MRIHYEQLLDLSHELEENENDFFDEDNTRYFHLFTQRVSRLHDLTASLREYSIQIRALYQSQLDITEPHYGTAHYNNFDIYAAYTHSRLVWYEFQVYA